MSKLKDKKDLKKMVKKLKLILDSSEDSISGEEISC